MSDIRLTQTILEVLQQAPAGTVLETQQVLEVAKSVNVAARVTTTLLEVIYTPGTAMNNFAFVDMDTGSSTSGTLAF